MTPDVAAGAYLRRIARERGYKPSRGRHEGFRRVRVTLGPLSAVGPDWRAAKRLLARMYGWTGDY